MKKRFKSVLGIALVLMLILSFIPATAFAEADQTEVAATDQAASATDIGAPETPAQSPSVPDDTQPSAPPALTAVSPELVKVVDKPLVTVEYQYYDDAQGQVITDFSDYPVSATCSYYAIAMVSGDRITITADKFPGKVPVSTDALRFRVLLNGSEDITILAAYDASTGLVSLPHDYMGHEITIIWYCPASEVTNLPVKVTICTGDHGKFTTTTKDLLLPSDIGTITVPLTAANYLNVTQNGIDLPDSSYSVKNGSLTISASALGGNITVSAYALPFVAADIGILPANIGISPADIGISPADGELTEVYHTRSADQIFYGYYTSYYTANGNTAYCLDPTVGGVHDGAYPVSRYLQRGVDDLLIKCAYYLYGGPGYDGIKYSLFSDPDSLVSYGLCHATCAYAYLNNNNAFFQLDQATIDIIRLPRELKFRFKVDNPADQRQS